jgi:hypothetical protein
MVYCLWSSYWSESERSLFFVVHDIGERKKAEDAMKGWEKQLQLVIVSFIKNRLT